MIRIDYVSHRSFTEIVRVLSIPFCFVFLFDQSPPPSILKIHHLILVFAIHLSCWLVGFLV